jgi:hypothetical protein
MERILAANVVLEKLIVAPAPVSACVSVIGIRRTPIDHKTRREILKQSDTGGRPHHR